MTRPTAHGFTLIELMLVVSIVSILAAVTAPSLTSLGKRSTLRGDAHALAASLAAARQHAVSTGRCVVVCRDPSNQRKLLVGEAMDPTRCEETAAAGNPPQLGGVNTVIIPAISFEVPNSDGVTIAELQLAGAATNTIVIRPNGYLRGTTQFGTGAGFTTATLSALEAQVRLRSNANMAANLKDIWVKMSAMGLVCLPEEESCP